MAPCDVPPSEPAGSSPSTAAARRLLRDGVVVLEGDRILHVGPRFDGTVDETLDASDRVLTPGLISTHAHMAGSPLDRSFIEDRGGPQFWYSGLFEMLPVRSGAQDEEAARACVDFSMAELLRGGVTTVMEIGGLGERVLAADERAILIALQAGGERMWPRMAKFDWAGCGADQLSPQAYPEWKR